MAEGKTLVLFDGVCGFCDRLVHFLLKRDGRDRLVFAPIQSDLAAAVLEQYGEDPQALNTMFAVTGYGTDSQQIHTKSRAAIRTLASLGGIWAWVLGFLVVPRFVANPVYAFFAARRYRWFGKMDACPMPKPEWREKFLAEG